MGKALFRDRFFDELKDRKLHTSNTAAARALTAPLSKARPGADELTPQQINRWRHAEEPPSLPILCAMSDYFGVTVDYLLGRSDGAAPPDLAAALAEHVKAQLGSNPVWVKNGFGRVARTSYSANPGRLLRFVVAAVRAAEIADRQLQAQEGTTFSLYSELQNAATVLDSVGKVAEAKHARAALRRTDKAVAEQFAPRLIRLFDGAAETELPELTITTAPPAST